jgi:hypothetical protein
MSVIVNHCCCIPRKDAAQVQGSQPFLQTHLVPGNLLLGNTTPITHLVSYNHDLWLGANGTTEFNLTESLPNKHIIGHFHWISFVNLVSK